MVELEEARGGHVPPPIPGVDDDEEVAVKVDDRGEAHLAPSDVDESIAEYPEEIANLDTLINLLKIEIRRAAISVRTSAPIQELVISGVTPRHEQALSALEGETGLKLEFVDLLAEILPRDATGDSKIHLPDSALIPATAGVAISMMLGNEGSGINYLSGDLAPASTFDYVKWPIAFALTALVMCLGFMFVIAFKEPQKLDRELQIVAGQKGFDIDKIWAELKVQGDEFFTVEKAWDANTTQSAKISAAHRLLNEQLSKLKAGDKGNYPPVYPADKIMESVFDVLDSTVGVHPSKVVADALKQKPADDKREWAGEGFNQNFALESIQISQKITTNKAEASVKLEVFVDPNGYKVPKAPSAGPEIDVSATGYEEWLNKKTLFDLTNDLGIFSEPELIVARLSMLRTRNPAWDGVDEASKYIHLVEADATGKRAVRMEEGDAAKDVIRGERLINGQRVSVPARSYTFSFDVQPVEKKARKAN
ncbi:MAG: hypothetical protein KDB07_09115 [Planctomycetes bacterium]|nr:hypothetical protein [Planctomycetota bacterium]